MFARLMGLKTISPGGLHDLMQRQQVTVVDVNRPERLYAGYAMAELYLGNRLMLLPGPAIRSHQGLPGGREITRGNSRLAPTTSDNIDLLAEHYFRSVGVVSGGVFFKRLHDYIFPFRFQETAFGDLYEVTEPRNGDSASTNAPLRYYEGVSTRPIQEEYYRWWASFGVRMNF